MNLRRASTYIFADRQWPRKIGVIALVSPVPVIGQLWAMGYANLCLRQIANGGSESELPEVKLGWELCWEGVRVLLVTMICGLAVALLGMPLFAAQAENASAVAPAIVQALQGPSSLLVAVASSVVTSVVLLRFALTGTFGGGFSLSNFWSLLRSEPAIWISYALIGFLVTEGPYGLVWVLPLHGGWDVGATLAATTVIWVYGLTIKTHLIAQAYEWSRRTVALRNAEMGYRY